ncbi:transporter substrate-binding domain-containing protein [Massilia sp. DJPM01]|uniref:substrate-binding periplasmic protein n=1 Tax=Massilia sp. DJPM01 TaxID=3024404 RepID=UPI00259FC2E6|nr:transporter substrate-binding domain-containing protein [Massilia sp. DJPM01]MDM5181433.1 transporter substrate-binding domain-containing protein [Massilia sp. DJPM01]
MLSRHNSAVHWFHSIEGGKMKCIGSLLLVCGALAGPPQPARAETPTLHLASLEWLPYVGRGLPDGGLSGAVAKAVAARFGYGIRIDYFPWKRAMQAGGSDPDFVGYFPAYHTAERARQCHFSTPMGKSTVGLAMLAEAPLRWRVLDDLAGNKLGVVLGYSNGDAFDQMVKSGKLSVDASESDIINLRKLLAGRIHAVVIDKAVLRYLLASDPTLSKERTQLVFDERPLAELTLHVCFQRTPLGLKLKQSYDAALLQTDIAKIENGYFDQLGRSLGAVRR